MWKFLVSQTDEKWWLRQFSTHVTTFHYLWTTLTTNGDDILTTLKNNGKDTLNTPFTTHDYLLTTLHDVTDDPCDNIDDSYDIHCPHDWDQVMKRTTTWQKGRLMSLTDDVVNLVWWPMWLLLTTCDDRSDNPNTTPTTLMTTGDYLWRSMWWPVDDPRKFLDNNWWLHLAIFIAKVESCLSCWVQCPKVLYAGGIFALHLPYETVYRGKWNVKRYISKKLMLRTKLVYHPC